MEEALIAKLLATGAVAAIVDNRIFPGSVPQGMAIPAIAMHRIDGAPLYTDDGECGLVSARLQFDCWAATYSAAKTLGRAVVASLSAFAGSVGGATFQNILLDAERDFRESGSNVSEYRFRTSLDFIVWQKL